MDFENVKYNRRFPDANVRPNKTGITQFRGLNATLYSSLSRKPSFTILSRRWEIKKYIYISPAIDSLTTSSLQCLHRVVLLTPSSSLHLLSGNHVVLLRRARSVSSIDQSTHQHESLLSFPRNVFRYIHHRRETLPESHVEGISADAGPF